MKVLTIQTWDSRLDTPKYIRGVNITVGNFVLLQEYDEHDDEIASKEKPWIYERTIVLLPIKLDIMEIY